MSTIIKMPRLSDTMTEGIVSSWLKKVGDKISEGDILAEIQTDKAIMEFESFNEGFLLYIGIQEGESAPIDSLLAIIGEEHADISQIIENFKKSDTSNIDTDRNTEIIDVRPNEIKTIDKKSNSTEKDRVLASPLAKAMARERKIDLSKIERSSDKVRITKIDIENYPSYAVTERNETNSVIEGARTTRIVKNSTLRKAIVKSLKYSQDTSIYFTISMDIRMDNAILSRKEINSSLNIKISFNDLIIKACAMALTLHPQINTQFSEEATIYNEHISIGIAIAIEDGLVVATLPFADIKKLSQISEEVKILALKAKERKLSAQEMSQSTFTISNLGMFGVDSFTSIINQPNSAILSVGAIKEKAIVVNGNITVGNIMNVTLACDHSTIDGAIGADFLNTLKRYMEHPITMIV